MQAATWELSFFEMFMGMPDGTEFKSLENRCIRKK